MAQILVVCTGNVCRSPLLERLLQSGLDEAYGPGVVEVASAGTGALVGAAMDERSAAILGELGGAGDGFTARRITEAMIRKASLVLTATLDHRAAVVRLVPRALRSTFTVRELALLSPGLDAGSLPREPDERVREVARRALGRRALNARVHPAELDVVDPYRRPDETYAQMREQLVPAVKAVIEVLTP